MEFTIPEINVVLEIWHLVVGYIIIAMISSRLIYRFSPNEHLSDEQNRDFCAAMGVIWPGTFIAFFILSLFDILFVPRSPKK